MAVHSSPSSTASSADPRIWDGLAEPVLALLRTHSNGLLRSELNAWAEQRPEMKQPGRFLNVLAHLVNQQLVYAEVVSEELRKKSGELPVEAVRWRIGSAPKKAQLLAPGRGKPLPIRG